MNAKKKTTYKYKVIETSHELTATKLNEFGRRGYELVAAIKGEYLYTFYFRILQD